MNRLNRLKRSFFSPNALITMKDIPELTSVCISLNKSNDDEKNTAALDLMHHRHKVVNRFMFVF